MMLKHWYQCQCWYRYCTISTLLHVKDDQGYALGVISSEALGLVAALINASACKLLFGVSLREPYASELSGMSITFAKIHDEIR